jgi:hypothetical protein
MMEITEIFCACNATDAFSKTGTRDLQYPHHGAKKFTNKRDSGSKGKYKYLLIALMTKIETRPDCSDSFMYSVKSGRVRTSIVADCN